MLSTSSSMCSSYLGTSSSTNRLCAWAKGTDTCQGDSGGPLTVAEGGKYTLLGVVSYGAGCASSTPGIYARVQGFLPWIHNLISSGECSTGSTTTTTGKPTSGTFSSKNFPSSYPINFDETKTIEVDSGRRIKVTFTAFSLEQGWNCVWDYLQVGHLTTDTEHLTRHLQVTDGDGSVLLKKSCGTTKPDPFTSKTNKSVLFIMIFLLLLFFLIPPLFQDQCDLPLRLLRHQLRLQPRLVSGLKSNWTYMSKIDVQVAYLKKGIFIFTII